MFCFQSPWVKAGTHSHCSPYPHTPYQNLCSGPHVTKHDLYPVGIRVWRSVICIMRIRV